MRRTREEALATRTRILDCAETVFVETGVERATLADIATAAGVTRGAIYGHFANKTEVYEAVVARVKQPMDALFVAANHPRAADPIATLHQAMSACLREMADDPRTARVFSILLAHNQDGPSGLWRQQAGKASTEARTLFAKALRNAVRRQQLPGDLDIPRAAALLKAALVGILRDWLLDPAGLALPKDSERICESLLDMVRFSAALRKQGPRKS